jgi:hypothetical protein
MENSGKLNNLTANQKLNGDDATFVLRCFHQPEMDFRHSLTNDNRD